MSRKKYAKLNRGYFGIGIYKPKTKSNLGTLWRSAYQLGASFIFTIGERYQKQISDTVKAYRHIPMINYKTVEDFLSARPMDCLIVPIEFNEGSVNVSNYGHPERAIYLLGAEDFGFDNEYKEKIQPWAQAFVEIPSIRTESFNVSVAGSIVMYDRLYKQLKQSPNV